jgi:hypothetical protein
LHDIAIGDKMNASEEGRCVMCNAWHHPFGCACGFGPPIMGYRINDLIGFVGKAAAQAVFEELSPIFWEPVAQEIKTSAYKTIENYRERGISYGYGWNIKANIPSELCQAGMKDKLTKWLQGMEPYKNIKVTLRDKTKDGKPEQDANKNILKQVIIQSSKRDMTDNDIEPLLKLLDDSSNKDSDESKKYREAINSIKTESKKRVCNEFVWDVLRNAGLQPGPETATKGFNSSQLFIEITKPLPGDVAMVGGYSKNKKTGELEWHGHTGICLEQTNGDLIVAHIGSSSGPSEIEWSAITSDDTYKDFKTKYYRPIMGSKSFRKYYDKITGVFSKKKAGKGNN